MSNHKEKITSNKSKINGLFYRTRKIGRTKRWVTLCTIDGIEIFDEIYVPQLGNRTTIAMADQWLEQFSKELDLDWTIAAESILISAKHMAALDKTFSLIKQAQDDKYEEQYKYQRENAKGKPRKH